MNHTYRPIDFEKTEQNRSKASLVRPLAEEHCLKPSNLEMEDEMMGLHRGIEALLPETGAKIIQFIGAKGNEGTSTIVREFARVSALKFNQSVLIIDADERTPSQLEYFGIQTEHGLEDAYRADEDFKKALHPIAKTRLYVSAYRKRSVPAQKNFNALNNCEIWSTIRNLFDIILVDSPSANTSSDALAISPKTDGVVLVIEAEKTRWPVAENTKKNILKNGGKFLGMVLNKRKHHIPEMIYKSL
jgi:Mrp family chromosome partitioning ATPase